MKRTLKFKYRNPVQRELQEERKFRIKAHDDRRRPPKEPTIQEALAELEEIEEDDVV